MSRTSLAHPKRWIAVGLAIAVVAVGGTAVGLASSGASQSNLRGALGPGLAMAAGASDNVTCAGPQLNIVPRSATQVGLGCAPNTTVITTPASTTTVPGTTTTVPATTTTTGSTTTTTQPTTTTTTPATGFPNASNTGVPAGTTLVAYTGPSTVSACGTVINGVNLPNGITITASNGSTNPATPCVTIMNSKISGVLFTGYGGSGPTVIKNSEIIGSSGSTTPPLWQANWYGYNLNVHGGRGQPDCDGPCGLYNSYVHDEVYSGATHMQAFETNGDSGGPIVLSGNTFFCNPSGTATGGGGCAGDVSFFGDNSQISNTTVTGNLFMASTGQFGFCVYTGAEESSKAFPTGKNISWTNNTFQAGRSGKCGDAGPVADWQAGNGNVWSGNHYDTGAAINP